jgi:hypothetical protein
MYLGKGGTMKVICHSFTYKIYFPVYSPTDWNVGGLKFISVIFESKL